MPSLKIMFTKERRPSRRDEEPDPIAKTHLLDL